MVLCVQEWGPGGPDRPPSSGAVPAVPDGCRRAPGPNPLAVLRTRWSQGKKCPRFTPAPGRVSTEKGMRPARRLALPSLRNHRLSCTHTQAGSRTHSEGLPSQPAPGDRHQEHCGVTTFWWHVAHPGPHPPRGLLEPPWDGLGRGHGLDEVVG